jgi:hypothetical protein
VAEGIRGVGRGRVLDFVANPLSLICDWSTFADRDVSQKREAAFRDHVAAEDCDYRGASERGSRDG